MTRVSMDDSDLVRGVGRLWLGVLFGLVALDAASAADRFAVKGGTLVKNNGEKIENATIVIEGGVIKTVGGADVEIPFDATVIDATGKVLFPGTVLCNSTMGLDRPNENLSIVPFVSVYDAIDPGSALFEDALRVGLTTVHVSQANNCVIAGMARVVRPLGALVEYMTVTAEAGIKISITAKGGNNSMTQMAELRNAFFELDQHVQQVAERLYEEEQARLEKKVLIPPEEAIKAGLKQLSLDDLESRWRTLYRVKNGELPVYLHCDSASDILRGIGWVKEMNLLQKTVFVVGTEAFKVVGPLKAAGRPVILSGNLVHRELDYFTNEEKRTFVPKLFADAQVPFALQTFGGSLAEGVLWYQASRMVREGVSREVALNSITQWPADVLGLGALAGSLDPGKFGNVLVLSGDPLDQSTVVETVVIEGSVVYERAKDRRLQELLKGEKLPPSGN